MQRFSTDYIVSGQPHNPLADTATFASILDVQNYETTITASSGAILVALTQATQLIQSYCQRDFLPNAYTEYYDGNNSQILQLNNVPVCSITSVTVDNIATTTYRLDKNRGWLYRLAGNSLTYSIWGKGIQNIVVDYIAGYTLIPQDINLVCTQITQDILKSSEYAHILTSETEDEYRYQWSESGLDLLKPYHTILNTYRHYL